MDRGKEFLSRAVIAAFNALEVTVEDFPVCTPRLKGTVEGLNGAVESMFLATLPGYVHQPCPGRRPELPPGERAVVRVLLDDYPFAALGSLRALADRADVSPPTASRLVARLGFGSFAEFQGAVRATARERDRSRLREFVTQQSDTHQAAEDLRTGMEGTLAAVTEPLLATTAARLAESSGVWALGGPLSELAADYLIRQLTSLRPGAHRVPGSPPARARSLLDMGPSDVVVATASHLAPATRLADLDALTHALTRPAP
ncbi:MurR/RpiR family transcriptional regulator (plasmid) [Streptomyces sp. NBC_01527]|uniref:MurR/RpiR family transcriptional regulator n=1 Tax=Streptomyces sp. NBC_01527 TaxID=2903894 RepID=UPI002F91A9C2